MRICFVVDEIFAWAQHGGFGALTRSIGKGLVKEGLEVFIITKKREGQKTVEIRDGMSIIGLPRNYVKRYLNKNLCKLSETDIYHSQEATVQTWLTMKSCSNTKHIITFQDPRTFEDIWKIYSQDETKRKSIEFLKYKVEDFCRRTAIKKADALFCQAKYMIPLVKEMFNLDSEPRFLPNPVEIPERRIEKAENPTVCFLGRWDHQKKPDFFFELAKEFPDVGFIAMGKAHDKQRDDFFRNKYKNIPNLEMTGFVTEEEKSEILEKSWIMINTSIREGLPVSFLEAGAHKCAILSAENPDNFASDFGYRVKDDNFKTGLEYLLEENRWKTLGEKGYQYVKKTHEYNKVIKDHIKVYQEIIE